MSDTPDLLLAHHLKALKLPTFLREYDKVARQCAAEGIDHSRYLLQLAELELIDRERRMVERRIKAARFPAVKSLDSFEFKAIPSSSMIRSLYLASCFCKRRSCLSSGRCNVGKLIEIVEEQSDERLPALARQTLGTFVEQLHHADRQIAALESRLKS